MKQPPVAIPKEPALKPAEDFHRLRREALGWIEKLASRQWTDYNIHDPGVTVLEALCYAITDLAHRIGWDIRDLLAPPAPPDPEAPPFPNQPFFTARDILTVNPWTPDDFRRLLIDLDPVRNAWVFCKQCACDIHYYAWCEDDRLILSHGKPADPELPFQKVEPLGLLDVLFELEADPELGDLNDRKIEHVHNTFDDDGRPHPVVMELRLPDWGLAQWDAHTLFLESADAFAGRNGASFDIKKPLKFNRSKTDDAPMSDAELRKNWSGVFYIDFEMTLLPGGQVIPIRNASVRLFGDAIAKSRTTVDDLAAILADKSPFGPIQRYRNKLLKADRALVEVKRSLHDRRNLCEDGCHVKGVDVEDVAVCADVEAAPDADIERVQAEIWFRIEQYFNPPIPFYTLRELMDEGVPVEEIFNGPALDHGFIKSGELEAAGLKTVLRASDIVNRLMAIDGVVAVDNLQLTKYDSEGRIVKGAADPDVNDGAPLFDAQKTSASWLFFVTDLHQPRLYRNQSRFLFYKNGLPFLPRMDEARDALLQLRGQAERPKIKNAPKDLPVPRGAFRDPGFYSPVQYNFPRTYGVGPEGLPSHASNPRRAQAKQMKAYLMVFEQHLANAFTQLSHVADLFSLDPAVRRTCFVREFTDAVIKGYSDLIDGLDEKSLNDLVEDPPRFHERRNRFLDHIMARFGEQFTEYALLLANRRGERTALDRLIDSKISFLKAYPSISRNRARAFNHMETPGSPENIPGLAKRVHLLLGYPDLAFSWIPKDSVTITHYELKDRNGVVKLNGAFAQGITGSSEARAKQKAYDAVIVQMNRPDAWEITPEASRLRLRLKDKNDDPPGEHPELFHTAVEARGVRDELMSWGAAERTIVVEHLLLRPKFPGDALYPACAEGPCRTCGDEDPYSFRLTFVMPGWTAPFNTSPDMRSFAERTIRREIPSHLLGKICWVGNEGFTDATCDRVLDDLAELMRARGVTSDGERPGEIEACDCAIEIHEDFSTVFKNFCETHAVDGIRPGALEEALAVEFAAKVNPDDISCTTVLAPALWSDIQTAMVRYFHHVALYGMQFERFEDAWRKWLAANAALDWTSEHLQERVQAILEEHLEPDPVAEKPGKERPRQCAAAILTAYGAVFYEWMNDNLKAGRAWKDFTPFVPAPVEPCPELPLEPGAAAKVEALLENRYDAYKEVSYRLSILVNLLARLRNTHPGATLHDCDEGDDRNPVRLGSTALGAHTLKTGG